MEAAGVPLFPLPWLLRSYSGELGGGGSRADPHPTSRSYSGGSGISVAVFPSALERFSYFHTNDLQDFHVGHGEGSQPFPQSKGILLPLVRRLNGKWEVGGYIFGFGCLDYYYFFPFPISGLFTHVGSIRNDLNQRFVMHMSLKKTKKQFMRRWKAYVLPRQFEGHPG